MTSGKIKAIIIICIIATAVVALIFAPLLPATSQGTEAVDYDPSIQQVNLVVNVDSGHVRVEFDNSSTAQLVNVTWDYTLRYAIVVPPPTPTITFQNYTAGTTLNVLYTVVTPWLFVTGGYYSTSIITINPELVSNLTITTTTGNVNLSSTNFQNKTFIDIKLTATTGNIDATLIDDSNITGLLDVEATTGGVVVTLQNGCILNNDFSVETTTGNSFVYLNNISLNDHELTGTITASTGSSRLTITQQTDLHGNLTITTSCTTGNSRLVTDFDASEVSSTVGPTTTTGTIYYGSASWPYKGFNKVGSALISTNQGLANNIDVTISVTTGNIDLTDVAYN